MKSQFKLLLFLTITALFLSCGNDNSTGPNSDPDPVPDPDPAPNVISKEIGPDGGEITSADGLLTLTFPAGALASEETITIAPLDADNLGSEFDQLASAEVIAETYELGPDGLEFDQPVMVNFDVNQIPAQNNDTLSIDSGFLFTSSDGALELLDSLQTMVDFNEGTVTVQGQLSHFSPLATSQANNGVSFFVFGVPDMLEVDGSFTANAQIFGSMAGPLADIVTVPGPARYEDRSGNPIVSTTSPPSGELPGNSTNGFIGSFDYTCNDLGLGIYQSDLSVQVIFNLDSEEIQAESFANFLTTVNCVEEMPATVNLQIALDGDGSGSVSSNPAGIACPDDCAEEYNEDTKVTLTATPGEGSVFVTWSGDIADNAPQDSVIIVTMNQARNITATFAQQQAQSFMLTVLKDGTGTGTVTSDPPGIDFGSDNTEDYDENTMVTLTATPDEGSVFEGWSGDIGSGNNPDSPSIQVTMDQARSVTATFDVKQTGSAPDVFSAGTGSPREISWIPNPWAGLNFNTDCEYLMVIAGRDLAFVDPCTGDILVVFDITSDIATTGLNGVIPLLPVEDANGVTRNWLLVTSESSGWLIMEIVLDDDGKPQMGVIRGKNGGFIVSAKGKGDTTGGTSSAIVTSRFVSRISVESSDMDIDGSYDGFGKTLIDVINGKLPGDPSVAYRLKSTENGDPGTIIGVVNKVIEDGDNTNFAFTSTYNIANGMYDAAVTWGEVGDDVRDMDCVELQNSDTNETEVFCVTANLLGESMSRLKMQGNSVEVKTEDLPIGAPIAVDAQIASNGNIQVLVAGFLGQVYVAEYDPSSENLITDKVISLPLEFTGVTDARFDPNNPGRAIAIDQNNDMVVFFGF